MYMRAGGREGRSTGKEECCCLWHCLTCLSHNTCLRSMYVDRWDGGGGGGVENAIPSSGRRGSASGSGKCPLPLLHKHPLCLTFQSGRQDRLWSRPSLPCCHLQKEESASCFSRKRPCLRQWRRQTNSVCSQWWGVGMPATLLPGRRGKKKMEGSYILLLFLYASFPQRQGQALRQSQMPLPGIILSGVLLPFSASLLKGRKISSEAVCMCVVCVYMSLFLSQL